MKKAGHLNQLLICVGESHCLKRVSNLSASHPDYAQYGDEFPHDQGNLLIPFPPFYAGAEKQDQNCARLHFIKLYRVRSQRTFPIRYLRQEN